MLLTLLTITLSSMIVANALLFTHNYLHHRRLEKDEFLVHLASVDIADVAELIGRVDHDLAEDIYRLVNASQDRLAQVRL